MNEVKELLNKNNFQKVGEIKNDLSFKPTNDSINKEPSVYVWLAVKKENLIPIYVGKAGKGAIKRFKEHKRGFLGPKKNGSKSGENKSILLKRLFNLNYSVLIFERVSEKTSNEILKAINITNPKSIAVKTSLNSSEEEVFIKLFSRFGFNEDLILNNKIDVDKTKKIIGSHKTQIKNTSYTMINKLEDLNKLNTGLEFNNFKEHDNFKSASAKLDKFHIVAYGKKSGLNFELRGINKSEKKELKAQFKKLNKSSLLREDSVYYPWKRDFCKTMNECNIRISLLKEIAEADSYNQLSEEAKILMGR